MQEQQETLGEPKGAAAPLSTYDHGSSLIRGAIIDWAVEIPPFFFCIKAYGWLQLLVFEKW